METLTEAQRQLEDPFVSSENQKVPGGIQNGRANLTVFQMLLDLILFRSFQVMVEVA